MLLLVNFMCKLGWVRVPRYLIKYYPAHFHEGVFKMRLTFKPAD